MFDDLRGPQAPPLNDVLSATTVTEVGDLIKALDALLADSAAARTMGTAAAIAARERYDWRVVIARYVALWNELPAAAEAASDVAPAPDINCYPYQRVFAHYPSDG